MKKRHIVFTITFSAIILIAIFSLIPGSTTTGKAHSSETSQVVLILFSDENKLAKERVYYNAIQHLQMNHHFSFHEFIFKESTDRRSVSYYDVDIDTFPCLLIYKGEEEILRLSGKQDFDQVVREIRQSTK
ncbi:hypothetical protein ACE1TH_03625 [Shouchella sp. JSM 1781072]|uniref:hypothetical protein n=1 Tax=Bacillaceae TaxID=186817 RepID=UPI000C07587C|nr:MULTISPECIES: hypothetical protein [Bacillaceae]UTR04903.1 hypothetical protein MM326_12265 [Alkalihalobacillus sp. LMS6]